MVKCPVALRLPGLRSTVRCKRLIQTVDVRLELIVGRASAAPPGMTTREYRPAIPCPMALRLSGVKALQRLMAGFVGQQQRN